MREIIRQQEPSRLGRTCVWNTARPSNASSTHGRGSYRKYFVVRRRSPSSSLGEPSVSFLSMFSHVQDFWMCYIQNSKALGRLWAGRPGIAQESLAPPRQPYIRPEETVIRKDAGPERPPSGEFPERPMLEIAKCWDSTRPKCRLHPFKAKSTLERRRRSTKHRLNGSVFPLRARPATTTRGRMSTSCRLDRD